VKKAKFIYKTPDGDRKHYVDEHDVLTVLERLPKDIWKRLRAVHFNDQSWGTRTLGYANCASKENSICALPPRVSLTRFLVSGQTAEDFGAVKGKQWGEIAVRRFLLYDVLLHELGHLQVVDEKAKNPKRRFANEKLAQVFADKWRMRLWAKDFESNDASHFPPSKLKVFT